MNILQHLHDHVVPNARNSYKPLALRHRSLSLYAGLLVAVKVFSLLSIGMIPQVSSASALSSTNILALTNASRTGYNLTPLKDNSFLDAAAQAKAQDMVANGYFAHFSPSGKSPWDFIKAQGYNYVIAGENLAVNYYSAEGVENAWMNSPGHKANILNKDFQDIGIGIAQGKVNNHPAIFVVQMFGMASDQKIAWKNSYTIPKSVSLQGIEMPVAKMIALAQPQVNAPSFSLIDQSDYKISGTAPAADTVYVLVNSIPVASLLVQQGAFSGTIHLPDGINKIETVSFYNKVLASPLSAVAQVQVDTSAPTIANADLQADKTIQVEVQGAPIKVVASVNNENIFLQPTADPNVWTGKFSTDALGKLRVQASDLAGNITIYDAASFTPNISETYGFAAPPAGPNHAMVYLYFFLGLLVLLGINIAIKKDVQHLGLIAHTSAIAVFALLLWLT